jgi:hypothetical protein
MFELLCVLAGAVKFVFVDDQAFVSDGAAGVDFVGADELSSV